LQKSYEVQTVELFTQQNTATVINDNEKVTDTRLNTYRYIKLYFI